MSNEAVLMAIQNGPAPMSKDQIRAALPVEMTSDQVAKALYNLWKRNRIVRLVGKDGVYVYRPAPGADLAPESLPDNVTLLSVTPTPTRLSEAKAQLVRALREEMTAAPAAGSGQPAVEWMASIEPDTSMMAEPTPPTEPESGASHLILPDNDADLPFSSNPQFEADPVLMDLARGINGHSIRNATVHIRRLRALALWHSIPQSVGQWLCDLATEIEQQAV